MRRFITKMKLDKIHPDKIFERVSKLASFTPFPPIIDTKNKKKCKINNDGLLLFGW
jgi:hypothetical protein